MIVDMVLSKLHKVKKTSSGWLACCPAHDDKRPSMTVTEKDGMVLMHCFSGCSIHEVLGAIGLEASDLYPKSSHGKPIKRPFNAHDVLECLGLELGVIVAYAHDVRAQKDIAIVDRKRFLLAISRIESARRLANG